MSNILLKVIKDKIGTPLYLYTLSAVKDKYVFLDVGLDNFVILEFK